MKLAMPDTPKAVAALVQGWKEQGFSVAFVPTMGALHKGHLSLVKLALEKADRCIVSIFVNPTQFAPHEDFDSYPRDVKGDIGLLEETGAHAVYLPSEDAVYPDGAMNSDIKAGAAAEGLEGDFRPHFFDGVVNVVRRLFAHVQPDIAVFGEKDYQQLCVVREMVEMLALPIDIIGAPIIRDESGLALSSRNAYLDKAQLEIARALNVILREKPPEDAAQALLDAGFDKVDYVAERGGRVLAAAWIGKTRLIDNMARGH